MTNFVVEPVDNLQATLPNIVNLLREGQVHDALIRLDLVADPGSNDPEIDYLDGLAYLQKSDGEIAKIEQLAGKKIHDFSALNDDLVQMTALLHVVDDYIGVSNTNMHLMASLGNASRVLVKQPGEWRWMSVGSSTPWMPRAVLYREDHRHGWAPGLKALRSDLSAEYEKSLARNSAFH